MTGTFGGDLDGGFDDNDEGLGFRCGDVIGSIGIIGL